jgi:hypothetical protein
VHCGPGPFSMASADTVSDLLRDAGFDRIALERFDADICIGRTLDDAVAFALEVGPAAEIIRLAGRAGEKCRGQAIAALRETFAGYQRADGIWAPSSTWLVTARNLTSIEHVVDHAVGELGLEPGRLGRHDAARIGNRHQVCHLGRIERKGNGHLA